MNDTKDYHVNIKTEQAGAFRILIEALKEILTEGNLIFDETGIKLMAMDSTHSILIHMKLDADNFEFFHCPKKMLVGVNMLNFFKLIKTMGNSETLTLFIETENENKLGILNIKIPPAEFETELSLPSGDFQKIIRDMVNIGENIEIKSIGSQLILNCMGDFASQETILGETNNGLKFNQISPQELPIQGVYSLKYLVLFTKCTGLCNQINLYIKNDYPLVIKYAVASLGNIKLCLAPNTTN